MLKSMTGFGQASHSRGQDKWVVEIRSVNHRFFDYSARLPQSLTPLESEIRNLVQTQVKRGKINLFVNQNGNDPSAEKVGIDEKKIDFYYKGLKKVASRLGIPAQISVRDLITLPHVFVVERNGLNVEKEWPWIEKTVKKAVANFLSMKEREGQLLEKDFLGRLSTIAKAAQKIKTTAEKVILQYQSKLKARVSELTSGLEFDQEKLAREVAIMADRADITEEIVRLDNHLSLFRVTLKEGDEVGKKLDFIIQEMNREVNTIGSKSLSFEISHEVIQIKNEIEKIREQVQNIE